MPARMAQMRSTELVSILSVMARPEKPVDACAAQAATVPRPQQTDPSQPGGITGALEDSETEDGQRQAQQETQETREIDLNLTHRERGLVGEHASFPAGGRPAIHHDLEGHTIYCLQRRGHGDAGRRSGPADASPGRRPAGLKGGRERDQGHPQRGEPRELTEMTPYPEGVRGVFGEASGRVVRIAATSGAARWSPTRSGRGDGAATLTDRVGSERWSSPRPW